MDLMHLNEFFDYKNQLMEDILTTDSIVKYLYEGNDYSIPAIDLAYTQVFPFEYIPDTITHGKTFICFDVDIQKASSRTFYNPIVYVWIFSHKSIMRLPEGGVRVDALASEIVKKINGSRMYGMGELDFYSSKRFVTMNDYIGKTLTFHAVDFNNPRPSNKQVPANRKRYS